MKSILHIITTIERGGAENQLLVLVNEQIKLGHKVFVLPLKGAPELQAEFETIGANVITELLNSGFPHQLIKARRMRRQDFDVIHAHLPRAELLSMMFIFNAKLISTKHNAETFLPNGPKLVSKMLARTTYVLASSTICISKSVKSYLVEQRELPKLSTKTNVVYYGTPRNPLAGKSVSKFSSFSKDSRIKLGTVSRLEAQKDLSTLIRAFAKFKEEYPFSTCEIIGAGSQLNDLRYLVNALGIADSVKFLGRTSHIHTKISSWDIFVLTSRYEGFGMVLLEALQCGRPIVASNNSAIPEVLGQDYPWLFNTSEVSDLLQKIVGLIQDLDNFDFLNFAENRLRLFDPGKMALEINAVYGGDV